MQKLIELSKITKQYKTKYGIVDVLRGVDLEVRQGDFLAVMGGSGSGKSTLLNIIGFMDAPTSGNYMFDGREISSLNENEKADLRTFKVGFVFQSYNLLNTMTALENVEIPLGYIGIGSKERRRRVMAMLEKVGVAHRAHHRPTDMSGGEQQRVAIARAMINEPLLILADEPTGNLDEKNAVDIMELLKTLNAGGTTVVMVTHDSDMVKYASHVINISKGKIV